MSTHGTTCPHCGVIARVRSSRQTSPLCRESVHQCRNTYCGHVFVTVTEAIRTLSPAAIANPNVTLPFTPKKAPAPDGQIDLLDQEPSGQVHYHRHRDGEGVRWLKTAAG
mgnify:FL=1